jgi:hypothetical protein
MRRGSDRSVVTKLLRSPVEALHGSPHASAVDSLDAQCLLMQLFEGQIRPPDLWRHERSGALSCAYEGSDRVFTWPAEDVAEMARTWRDSDMSRVPKQPRLFVDAHQRLDALAGQAGLGPAGVMIHDLGRAEVRGVWEDEKVVVVVDEIGKRSSASVTCSPTPSEAPRGPIPSA